MRSPHMDIVDRLAVVERHVLQFNVTVFLSLTRLKPCLAPVYLTTCVYEL